MGCTIHCRSWLVVIALIVGMKALLEPGMSTLYFCKEEQTECRGERGQAWSSRNRGGSRSIDATLLSEVKSADPAPSLHSHAGTDRHLAGLW